MDWMDWLLIEIPVLDVPAVVVAGLVGLWLLVRNRATPLDSSAELDAVVGRGDPVVLEFFGKL
jgi:hypothetical protein